MLLRRAQAWNLALEKFQTHAELVPPEPSVRACPCLKATAPVVLVMKPLFVQPGDANHGIATEFCQQNLQYHRCLDTSPAAVTASYEE